MKYILYGILVLTIMQYSRAQYRKIQLTDAKQVEHLKMEKRWNTRCKYDEGFIYNKDYRLAILQLLSVPLGRPSK